MGSIDKSSIEKNINEKTVICTQCVHFYITWDPKFPRGCRQYGFKTTKMPSITVRETIGAPCTSYRAKQLPNNSP